MEAVLWIVGVLVVMLGFPVMCNMRGDQQGVPPSTASTTWHASLVRWWSATSSTWPLWPERETPPPRAEPGEGGAHHRMVTCPYDKEDQPGHEYCH